MKEELKITGKGQLHGKDFGTMKLSGDEKEPTKKIIYDPELEQYCVDGQWEIPFGIKPNIGESFDNIIQEILLIKHEMVKEQKFEPASYMRDIERTLKELKLETLKLIIEKC